MSEDQPKIDSSQSTGPRLIVVFSVMDQQALCRSALGVLHVPEGEGAKTQTDF